ncbi:hypothetical protein DSM112329_02296 [Paraconexibacter sp. AEG42_29]|uniref:Proteinase inhibitor I42 chagasin domain-containing protein n=1 Tax=Paraconexibacter sp. AEG42_29 TaxID=2997339 RepID=A0AAU7AUR8_9ACTN
MSHAIARRSVALAIFTVVGALAVVPPAAEARTVTVKTSGKSVSLKVGDKLVVNLAENPSTGFTWKSTSRPSFLKLASSKYIADAVPEGIVGSGGRRVFTYTATKAGSGSLKLRYARSTTSTSDSTFTLRLTVKK